MTTARTMAACRAAGFSRLRRQLERLATDWIDIYYLHRDDPGRRLRNGCRDGRFDTRRQDSLLRRIELAGMADSPSDPLVRRLGVPRRSSASVLQLLNRMPEVEILLPAITTVSASHPIRDRTRAVEANIVPVRYEDSRAGRKMAVPGDGVPRGIGGDRQN